MRGCLAAAFTLMLAIYAGAQRPAYCWDKFAHEVIAQIAWDNMNPAARTSAASLIKAFNTDPLVTNAQAEYKPYNFVTAAAFMDDIAARGASPGPGTTPAYNSWHYIDLPDDPNLTIGQIESFRDQHPSNVYLAIRTACLPTLEAPYYPPSFRARSLAMFLHFAGDIHQPLHATGRGLGGNRYPIQPLPSEDPAYQVANLHEFWDGAYRYSAINGKITLDEPASDLPRVTAPDQGEVAALAKRLEAKYAKAETASAANLDPAQWALESSRIADTFAFTALNNATVLPDSYVNKAADIADQRLVLAGLRIANVLNADLGTPHAQPKWGG